MRTDSSPPAECLADLTLERRRRSRRVAQGQVRLVSEDNPQSPFDGHLVDWSSEGFRATHGSAALSSGQVVSFEHPLRSGRARVVWNRVLGKRVESGFVVLAD